MNRVLMHLERECPCRAAREHVERLAKLALYIEATTGELVEVLVPTPQDVMQNGRFGLKLLVAFESDELLINTAVPDAIEELRGLADSLWLAADTLAKGGVE